MRLAYMRPPAKSLQNLTTKTTNNRLSSRIGFICNTADYEQIIIMY